MEPLKQILPILLSGSLAGLVLTVGLKSSPGDLVYVLRRPKLFLKAMLAVEIIPPLAAALLVWLLPIDPLVKAGILLMAISPVPPLVPGQELGVGGRKEFAYGLYVAMVLLSILVVPLAFGLASRVFGEGKTIPFSLIAMTVLTGVIVPLGVGTAINRLAPRFAQRAGPWVYKISMVLVLLAFVPIIVAAWPAIVALVGNGTMLAMVVLVVATLAGGHLLGGPEPIDRMTLAVASSVRHPGLAMLLANASFQDKRVSAAVLLYLLVGLVVGTVYKQIFKRRLPRPAA